MFSGDLQLFPVIPAICNSFRRFAIISGDLQFFPAIPAICNSFRRVMSFGCVYCLGWCALWMPRDCATQIQNTRQRKRVSFSNIFFLTLLGPRPASLQIGLAFGAATHSFIQTEWIAVCRISFHLLSMETFGISSPWVYPSLWGFVV